MNEIYDILASYIMSRRYIPDYIKIAKQYLLDTATETLGIIIYPGRNDTPNLSGGYPYYNISIHLQYNASTRREDAINFIPVMEMLVRDLELDYLAGTGISIVSMQHSGPLCMPIGVNEHGISQLTSNIICSYAEIGG